MENVLFVCVENAGRSQMAESFFQKYAPEKYNVISAGITLSSQLHRVVVEVMREVGIDMTQKFPKPLPDDMIKNSSKTINMGCMNKESCPALFVKDVLDWNISNPKEKSIDDVGEIRDQILRQVLQLVKYLEK